VQAAGNLLTEVFFQVEAKHLLFCGRLGFDSNKLLGNTRDFQKLRRSLKWSMDVGKSSREENIDILIIHAGRKIPEGTEHHRTEWMRRLDSGLSTCG
jgi:hypothetical protein